MYKILKMMLELLNHNEKKRLLTLLIITFFVSIFDVAGVASIAPFFSLVSQPEIIETNNILSNIFYFFGFNDVNSSEDIQNFLIIVGVFVFIFMVTSLSMKAWSIYMLERFAQSCNFNISKNFVENYLRQDYSWFLNKNSASIGKNILSEVNAVVSGILLPGLMLFASISSVIVIILGLFILDPLLATNVFIPLIGIYLIFTLVAKKYLTNIGEDRVLANEERFRIVQSGFSAIKELKVSNLEHTLLEDYEDPAMRFAKHTATQHIIGKLPRYFIEMIAFGGVLALVVFLIISNGDFNSILPILVLYAAAGYRMMPSLQQVYAQLTTIRFSEPALQTLYKELDEMDLKEESKLIKQTKELEYTKSLLLENINYKYPSSEKNTISDLSLEIPYGSKVGFVGPTGSGKTTVIDIILGLLEPSDGKIIVDNNILDRSSHASLRSMIGYVPQTIFLRDGTVSENIAFGIDKKDVDIKMVKKAAEIAEISMHIEGLPNGYETQVGERGVKFSGGQRQRIGIARALYQNPRILILDEATSALDGITEEKVVNHIMNSLNNITIITIAHRLSTIKNCDEIFILDEGKLRGKGNYNSLIENNELFQALSQRS
jgi:ABC-type multidrug transport system fused ATPase/permease subunit